MGIYCQHVPYVYLIGWSKLNVWYYGRRTRKGCHPSDLWVKYWTSSKYVREFRKLHGDPDIIIIRKTFPDNPKKCSTWESKVLRRIDAKNDPRFLNMRNGDSDWDTTGLIQVLNHEGKIIMVQSDHPDRISGKLLSPLKGKVMVRDKNGIISQVSVNDEAYLSGELVHVAVGTKQSPETIENRVKHVRGVPKTAEHNRKNSEAHKGKTREITPEWALKIKETMSDKPKIVCPDCNREVGWHQSHLDAHYGSKNCKPLNTEVINLNSTLVCIHCKKESHDHANMKKNHGIYCKANPNRIVKQVKEHSVFTCSNCSRQIKSKGNLVQHMKKCVGNTD